MQLVCSTGQVRAHLNKVVSSFMDCYHIVLSSPGAEPRCYSHETVTVEVTDPRISSFQNIDGLADIPGLAVVDCPSNTCYLVEYPTLVQTGNLFQLFTPNKRLFIARKERLSETKN